LFSGPPKDPKDFQKLEAAARERNKPFLPRPYADATKSGLSCMVKEGPQQYDIVLK
jgi:hypothetical protein